MIIEQHKKSMTETELVQWINYDYEYEFQVQNATITST